MLDNRRSLIWRMLLCAALASCLRESDPAEDASSEVEVDSGPPATDVTVAAEANTEDSQDSNSVSTCNAIRVHDCECDPSWPEASQCCWRGTLYSCLPGEFRGPGEPSTQYDFEWQPGVGVDDCESIIRCPLDQYLPSSNP
jgi:hypothetical protein